MALTVKGYGLALQSLWEGRINLLSDPLMCMLVGADYVFNQNTHKFRSIVIDEIQGSGYVTGGKQITGIQLGYTTGTKTLKLTGSNLVWPGVTFEDAKGAVVYVGGDRPVTAQPLISYVDFGELVDRNDTPFLLNWPAGGILTMAVP